MHEIVHEYLFNYNKIEKKQRKTGEFVMDLPLHSFDYDEDRMILSDHYFLKNDRIYISKHNRFAAYPEHTHRFLELNYMLKGNCTQRINGTDSVLKEGQLLLLDQGSTHSIEPLGKDDILINIIFPQTKFDIEWLSHMHAQDNQLFQFLMRTVSEKAKGEYIIFHAENNQDLQTIMIQMLNKYFTESTFGNEILRFYLPILFMELVGNTIYTLSSDTRESSANLIVIEVLKRIEKDYRDITLDSLAASLSYNTSYLSEVIKEKTGIKFTELVKEQRMKQAILLIDSTDLPISEICYAVGLQNKTHFYKQFKDYYKITPGEYRKRTKI
ncbi:helix-turn-helix domain-containing protein [Alkalibacterium olivapovliticus]|uniref:AraC-like protein n=1 Tax=Alkalibacterium olivapovliticus TaxID=99907 RepID=A0A2T0VUN6_9LACT|nr:helix-turn-helix domain-containing protein [Alkalibacterium olivapovliticus]PRY75084.1 AraC-like protein [Alkalibacterium olivapovliticus]